MEKDWDGSKEFLEDIRGIIWNSQKQLGKTWETLAREAHLSPSTVAHLADGTTKRPQMRTIQLLMVAIGYQVVFVPNNPKLRKEKINKVIMFESQVKLDLKSNQRKLQ